MCVRENKVTVILYTWSRTINSVLIFLLLNSTSTTNSIYSFFYCTVQLFYNSHSNSPTLAYSRLIVLSLHSSLWLIVLTCVVVIKIFCHFLFHYNSLLKQKYKKVYICCISLPLNSLHCVVYTNCFCAKITFSVLTSTNNHLIKHRHLFFTLHTLHTRTYMYFRLLTSSFTFFVDSFFNFVGFQH